MVEMDGIRTDDPLLAKQVLYQLSYIPNLLRAVIILPPKTQCPDDEAQSAQSELGHPKQMVGQGGLEPPTPRLSSVCSNQLSY